MRRRRRSWSDPLLPREAAVLPLFPRSQAALARRAGFATGGVMVLPAEEGVLFGSGRVGQIDLPAAPEPGGGGSIAGEPPVSTLRSHERRGLARRAEVGRGGLDPGSAQVPEAGGKPVLATGHALEVGAVADLRQVLAGGVRSTVVDQVPRQVGAGPGGRE